MQRPWQAAGHYRSLPIQCGQWWASVEPRDGKEITLLQRVQEGLAEDRRTGQESASGGNTQQRGTQKHHGAL